MSNYAVQLRNLTVAARSGEIYRFRVIIHGVKMKKSGFLPIKHGLLRHIA